MWCCLWCGALFPSILDDSVAESEYYYQYWMEVYFSDQLLYLSQITGFILKMCVSLVSNAHSEHNLFHWWYDISWCLVRATIILKTFKRRLSQMLALVLMALRINLYTKEC